MISVCLTWRAFFSYLMTWNYPTLPRELVLDLGTVTGKIINPVTSSSWSYCLSSSRYMFTWWLKLKTERCDSLNCFPWLWVVLLSGVHLLLALQPLQQSFSGEAGDRRWGNNFFSLLEKESCTRVLTNGLTQLPPAATAGEENVTYGGGCIYEGLFQQHWNFENAEEKMNDFSFAAQYNFKFDWNSLWVWIKFS